MRHNFLLILAFSLALSSCASKNLNSTFIKKADAINLSELTRDSAIQTFGKPDVRDFASNDGTIEAFVYLAKDLKSPEAALLFDVETGKLVEANWFANDAGTIDLDSIKKRYPSTIFESDQELLKKGLYGQSLLKVHSKNTPLIVFLNPETKNVSSLSWRFSNKASVERKPTSH